MTGDGNDKIEPRHIDREMDSLEGVVARTEERANRLKAELDPVLVQGGETLAQPEAQEEVLAPLALKIREFRRTAHRVELMLDDLLDRLQL